MGSRLEIKADGDDVEAGKMLDLATLMLKLLRSVERETAKAGGKRLTRKNRIRWRVDIQSGFSYGLIAIRAEAAEGQRDDAIHQETSQAMMKAAMKLAEQPAAPGAQELGAPATGKPEARC